MKFQHLRTGKIRDIKLRRPPGQDWPDLVYHEGDEEHSIIPLALWSYDLLSATPEERQFLDSQDTEGGHVYGWDDNAIEMLLHRYGDVKATLWGTHDSIEEALRRLGFFPDDYDIGEIREDLATFEMHVCDECGRWTDFGTCVECDSVPICQSCDRPYLASATCSICGCADDSVCQDCHCRPCEPMHDAEPCIRSSADN